MLNQKQILSISQQAIEEKWPFPKSFQALEDAGVQSYEVDLLSHQVTYYGAEDSFTLNVLQEKQPAAQGSFNSQAIEKAIRDHQAQKTNYAQLCSELTAHGVERYRVDMPTRMIHYIGRHQETHTETVP